MIQSTNYEIVDLTTSNLIFEPQTTILKIEVNDEDVEELIQMLKKRFGGE